MNLLHDISYFFAGAFLANAVPHFVSGVMGRVFQSPFAKPPGRSRMTCGCMGQVYSLFPAVESGA